MKLSKNFWIVARALFLLGVLVSILWALFVPPVGCPPPYGGMGGGMKRGRAIYLQIWGSNEGATVKGTTNFFPSSDEFTTSTEFFKYLMEKGDLEPDFSQFAYPGSELTIDSVEDFTAEHNMWSIVVDVNPETVPPFTPLLISCNVTESGLQDGQDARNSTPIQMSKDRRFKGHVFFVTANSSVGQLVGDDLIWENLNPTESTHKILHP